MVDNWGWGSKEIHWVSSPWILTCQRYKNLHVGRGLPNPVTKALILRLNFSLGIVYKSTATQGGLRRESTPLFACCLNTAAKTKLEQPSLLQYLFATLPSCLPIPHFLTPNFLSLLFSLTLIQNKMLEVSRILFSFELLNNVSCRNVLVLYGKCSCSASETPELGCCGGYGPPSTTLLSTHCLTLGWSAFPSSWRLFCLNPWLRLHLTKIQG